MVQLTVAADSLRQVDRIKATTVGKSYPLTLTKEYVSKWGLPEAVRELIQNALDSQSPFVYSWTQEDDAWTLMLNSELTVLSPQTLLLGATTKATDSDSIGSFGEGYKLALLVLTRLGVHVDMLNGDVLWRPVFRYHRNFDAEILHVDESFLQAKGNQGLTFYVRGLTEQDKESIVQSCIRMQDHIGAIKQVEKGDILLEQKGRLYVGGLFICETELQYGYNIKPQWLRLERDRQTVDNWDLEVITTEMWIATGEIAQVAKMVQDEFRDVSYARYNSPDILKEEVYKLFRQKHPYAVLAERPEQVREAIKKGLIETIYVGGGGSSYHSMVEHSSSYQRDVENWKSSAPVIRQPQEILSDFKMSYREAMSPECKNALDSLIGQARKWRIVEGE